MTTPATPTTTDSTPALELTGRERRALDIALRPGAIRSIGEGRFIVASQRTGGKTYLVWGSDSRCSCPDAMRGKCKHAIACELVVRAEAKVAAARAEGWEEELLSNMLTLSMQGEQGVIAAEVGLTADVVLAAAKRLGEAGLGVAA